MPKQPDRMVSVYSAVRLVQSFSASLTHSTNEGSNCKASVVAITEKAATADTLIIGIFIRRCQPPLPDSFADETTCLWRTHQAYVKKPSRTHANFSSCD